ncbi:CCA tRNA nucleotidyltransferase [Salinarimonas soli]|uniref:CCA tRNA nucleotidyltransferase n=1 Tax=Salinarimonas soli TaxID=1638099 RepID=A0A5B2VCE6_9HYPH|nr:CCA tRNA nucleotidyltransferase [Salinarimonas soli]KAA2236405.1 CCA tRNA nucleotidyltransferase [Salinarimonas soli]
MTAPEARDRLLRLLARPGVARLLAALNGDGEETRIVGGAVRNALLGHPDTDVDFTTTALPQRIRALAEAAGLKAVPTGVEHGTLTLIVGGEPFEVTSLREDVETDGRHAVVRFGRDFTADALRRDFTINALSLGADGTLHDPVGGVDDLRARRVRFIGDPDRRIAEDHLRVLRFFRFHAQYGEGPLDRPGFEAAIRGRDLLGRLSRERIRAEILKLMSAPRAVEVVAEVAGAGILARLLGAVGDLGRLARATPDGTLALAGYAVLVEEDASRLAELLRLSNDESARLAAYARACARLRSLPDPVEEAEIRRLVAVHGVRAVSDALMALRSEPRPVLAPGALPAFERFATGAEPPPALPVRGADLKEVGIPPGPGMGALLARARTAWLEGGCRTGPAERERLLRHIAGNPAR